MRSIRIRRLACFFVLVNVFLPWPSHSDITSSGGEPSARDIGAALTKRLNPPWVVDSLDILAIANIGDKVEPIWKFRFKAIAKLSESTYAGRKLLNSEILTLIHRKGEEANLSGLGVMKLGISEWEDQFVFDDKVLRIDGTTRSHFGDKVVFSDTPEAVEVEKRHEALSKEIAPAVVEYYNTESEWAGVYTLQDVHAMRLETTENGEQLLAHTRYSFKCIDKKKCGGELSGEDQRWFSVQRLPSGAWRALKMGPHMSAKL